MALPRTERWLSYRLTILLLVVAAFVAIFLCAPLLTGNLRIGPLSNRTVHKLGHFLVYGGLTLLLAKGLGGRGLLAGAIILALSSAAELQQLLIPGRCAAWSDIARNFLAVCLGLGACHGFATARRAWNRRGAPMAAPATIG